MSATKGNFRWKACIEKCKQLKAIVLLSHTEHPKRWLSSPTGLAWLQSLLPESLKSDTSATPQTSEFERFQSKNLDKNKIPTWSSIKLLFDAQPGKTSTSGWTQISYRRPQSSQHQCGEQLPYTKHRDGETPLTRAFDRAMNPFPGLQTTCTIQSALSKLVVRNWLFHEQHSQIKFLKNMTLLLAFRGCKVAQWLRWSPFSTVIVQLLLSMLDPEILPIWIVPLAHRPMMAILIVI